jgi:hypothetical protein
VSGLRAKLAWIIPPDQLMAVPILGGIRIKRTAHHYIDVMAMLYGFRVATTPIACPGVFDRGWCYYGTTGHAYNAAVLGAAVWDGADDTEPLGWNKNMQTGERR